MYTCVTFFGVDTRILIDLNVFLQEQDGLITNLSSIELTHRLTVTF